jgi:hypothetical protein
MLFIDKLLEIMASERQLQDRGKSAQADSLGIQDAQQVPGQTIIPDSPTNSDQKNDLEHSQQLNLLTKKLQEDLNSADTNATVIAGDVSV